jgi:hypothetical protein
MNINKTRSILAITIVVGVFLTTSLIILSGMQGGVETMKEYSGTFSGIIGTIIGYYFGKSGNEGDKSIKSEF